MPLSQPTRVIVDIDKIVVNSPSVTDEFDALSTQIEELETETEQELGEKAPIVHGHVMSQVQGLDDAIASLLTADDLLQQEIDGKQPAGEYAAANHSHSLGELGGTEGELANDLNDIRLSLQGKQPSGDYAASNHGHTIANVDGLQTALDGKQPAGNYQIAGTYAQSVHSHPIAHVDNLQNALDAKAASNHGHTIANVDGLQNALDGKQAVLTPGLHFPIVSTTPPDSPPQAGWQWTQLDANGRAIDWIWNGSKWLSRQRHLLTTSFTGSFSSTNFDLRGSPDNRLILLEDMTYTFSQSLATTVSGGGGLDSAIHYWDIRLLRLQDGGYSNFSPDLLLTTKDQNLSSFTSLMLTRNLNVELDCRVLHNVAGGTRFRTIAGQVIRQGGNTGFNTNQAMLTVGFRWVYT